MAKLFRDRTKLPKPENFWKYVDKEGPIHPVLQTRCWIWTGHKPKGYGTINSGRFGHLAHRVSYEWAYGPFDPDLKVLHRCDTPACVNPDHLFLGTTQDNWDDCRRKMRHRHGVTVNTNIMTEAQALECIFWVPNRGETRAQLAERMGVKEVTVKKARDGSNWKYLHDKIARGEIKPPGS